MATKAKFDIKDLKTEATKGLHAGVGAADLALETVKELDLQPKALRTQATTVFSTRVEELSKDAKARRTSVEKRVAELQAEAQKLVAEGLDNATGTYDKLAKRGEKVVKRVRKETSSVVDPGPVKKTTGTTVTASTTAKKAPAKKTTAKKAPAKKAAAK